MIHFVGAGPGAPDLITLRGKALLEQELIVTEWPLVQKGAVALVSHIFGMEGGAL